MGKQESRGGIITGETFLKDARQIDSTIEEMQKIGNMVTGLYKPYNDFQNKHEPAEATMVLAKSKKDPVADKEKPQAASNESLTPQITITI